jgi:oligopeptide/dipeptide ABC transporter ATP-binding protein
MRQRVMIAMAMAVGPDLLIADEPTTALDVTVQAQVLNVMRKLQNELGTAIILITHDLGVVAEMSDDIVVMYAGHAMEQASRRDLFYHHHNPYTEGLLASLPVHGSRGRLQPIAGTPPSTIDPPARCPFAPRCPYSFDKCWQEDPPLRVVHENLAHSSACWLPTDEPSRQAERVKLAEARTLAGEPA